MIRMMVLTIAMIAAAGAGVRAESESLVIKESAANFATTVQRVQAEIEKRGATVVATVDHAAAAKASGLELRPTTVIIFGNPALGTPLMQSQQTAGLDLPLQVLIWEDADGKVQIGYWAPAQIADLHEIDDREDVIGKMTAVLGAITDAAAGR